jgi:exosortase H (IPTLxxWG-CTERM-specific)
MPQPLPKQASEPSRNRAGAPNPARRFLLVFLGIVAAYYLLTMVPWVDRNLVYPVLELTAQASASAIRWTGEAVTTQGVMIQGKTFAVAIRRGCDPLDPMALFAAAILAFSGPWKRKAVGLVAGSITLFALNLLRIVSLYWLGQGHSRLFEAVHQEIWPAFFILCALGLWGLWLLWIGRGTQARHV